MSAANPYLMLTPAGALQAHSQRIPDENNMVLQSLMAQDAAPGRAQWLATTPEGETCLEQALSKGWVQESTRPLRAPTMHLDHFLPHAIAGLSHTRTAALASGDGFCLARSGYSMNEAETVCAAAVDFLEFIKRQQKRGFQSAGRAVSLFNGIDMLLPSTSFLLFWVAGNAYWLIIDDEPLINNTALVLLIWSLHRAAAKFEQD